MAYMVARTQKHKVGSLNGLQNHVDRKTKNHTVLLQSFPKNLF
ncbi:TPA: hypothetical protein ACIZFN_002715 [Enterococcus faecium]